MSTSRSWSRRHARAFVRTPTLELAAARLAFATGRPRDALEPLEWLVGLDDDEIIATGASYDERVFGEWSWGLIGLCRFALGDDGAAADAFRRAERYAPGDAVLRGAPPAGRGARRAPRPDAQPAVMPRSTERIAPWMLRPSSDATSANIAAMSSDEPIARNPV